MPLLRRNPASYGAISSRLLLAGIVAGIAIAVIGGLARRGWLADAQSAPVERIDPPAQTISSADAYAHFDVTIESISNLGAFEVLLKYDANVLAFPSAGDGFTGAENGPFLESSGRSATCQPAIITDVPATTKKQLRFGCNTTGAAAGASGSGVLATIRLKPVGIGATALELTPSLSDPLGNDLFATAVDGAVVVGAGPTSTPTATSTPCAGACPTATPTLVPAPSCDGATSPTLCFEPSSVVGHPNVAMTVDVSVAAVSDLGAVNFVVDFDPALVDFASFSPGPFLTSTGRTIFCLPVAAGEGSIEQTCVTLGTSPPGASGGGVIGTLTFVPRENGIGTLHFSGATLLTPDAQPVPPSGSVAVAGADVTIVDCVSACSTVTPSPVPTQTLLPTATATSTPTRTATPCAGVCPSATPTATFAPFTPTATPASASVSINPGTQSVAPGDAFGIDVDVSGATNVGAFQFALDYPAGAIALADAQPSGFLGSNGRVVQCNAPIVSDGSFSYSCFSFTSGSAKAGASGSGTLAHITLQACAAGEQTLTLHDVVLITPDAHALPLGSVSGGGVSVGAGGGGCATATATPTCASACATSTPVDTATPAPGGDSALGSVSPATNVVSPGDTLVVDVNVDNVSNLGAYEFTLNFAPDSPPAYLQLIDVEDEGFLTSTGRTLFCQPPFATVISVRFGCVTSGSAAGPSGSGTLARVRFSVINFGTGTLAFDLFQLSDPFGDPIASHVVSASVESNAAATATVTAALTATFTPTPVGTATPAPTDTPTPAATATDTSTAVATDTAAPTDTPAPAIPAGGFSGGPPQTGIRSGLPSDDSTQGGTVNERILEYWRVAAAHARELAASCLVLALAAAGYSWRRPRIGHSRLVAPVRRIAALTALISMTALLLPFGALAENPPGAVIYKSPSSANLFLGGQRLVFTENVAGADRGIAGFELRLRYDTEFVLPSFSPGPLLTSGGRTVSCQTVPLHAGDIVYSCSSSGAAAPSAGPGTLALLTVAPAPGLRIRATKDNGIATILDDALNGTRLFDVNGDEITVGQVTDANIVVRALEGDVNVDCMITVIDDQAMALRYPSMLGSLIYDPYHDLEPSLWPDEDIDIKDLQFVFGRNGSTCDHPVPPEDTPTPIETPGTPVVVTPTPRATGTAPARTATTTSGTPTVAHTQPASTGTPAIGGTRTPGIGGTTTPATGKTATPAPNSSPTANVGSTKTPSGEIAQPTATSTLVSVPLGGSNTRLPSGLPFTGGGVFPGGALGGLIAMLIALALTGAYIVERGRSRTGK